MSHDRPRLLVADADPHTSALIALILRAEAYLIEEAATLEEATARPESGPFDLILADGCCATREAFAATAPRLLAAAAGTPVLLLSALPLTTDEVRAQGFRDLLPKPFDLDDLIERVRAALTGTPAALIGGVAEPGGYSGPGVGREQRACAEGGKLAHPTG